MDAQKTTDNMSEGICARLDNQTQMELLRRGLDDIACLEGITREEALGNLALDCILGEGEVGVANAEVLLGRSTVREMAEVGLRSAIALDAGATFRTLAEAAISLIDANHARVRDDLTDDEALEFARLKELANADEDAIGSVANSDATKGSAVSLSDLATYVFDRWDEDGDDVRGYADIATILRLSEPWDECPLDRSIFSDALSLSWEDYLDAV